MLPNAVQLAMGKPGEPKPEPEPAEPATSTHIPSQPIHAVPTHPSFFTLRRLVFLLSPKATGHRHLSGLEFGCFDVSFPFGCFSPSTAGILSLFPTRPAPPPAFPVPPISSLRLATTTIGRGRPLPKFNLKSTCLPTPELGTHPPSRYHISRYSAEPSSPDSDSTIRRTLRP